MSLRAIASPEIDEEQGLHAVSAWLDDWCDSARVAQGALALKYIIELSHRVGQVRLQHDPRTYSTMSLVLRVFWLPSVTSLFITPEFQNSNALLAQEWVGGPGGVST